MSPDRNWLIRAKDIIDCIGKIKKYTSGITFDQFCKDDQVIDAVIRNLEIIGEAAAHIPLEVQEKYPDLAWLEMRGMRNIVVHEYFGVSLPIIWQTIKKDLNPLEKGFRKILKSHRIN
jgi:uncharacterized protein with HEPN domain